MTLEKIMKILLIHRVIKENGCWILDRKATTSGYSGLTRNGKAFKAHRISAAFYLGLDLNNPREFACHKKECYNRACWNPDHLYVGGASENMTDVIEAGKIKYVKDTCKKGHKLISGWGGKRHCRICKINYNTERRRKNGIKSKSRLFVPFVPDPKIDPVTGRKKV